MEGWNQVPRGVRNALTSDTAVKHADKMLGIDNRMRVFKLQDRLCILPTVKYGPATASNNGGRFIPPTCLAGTVAILQCVAIMWLGCSAVAV